MSESREYRAFRSAFLRPPGRRDSTDLTLLDELSDRERVSAEHELLEQIGDDNVRALGGLVHLGSQLAVPLLRERLETAPKAMRIPLAGALWSIAGDHVALGVLAAALRRRFLASKVDQLDAIAALSSAGNRDALPILLPLTRRGKDELGTASVLGCAHLLGLGHEQEEYEETLKNASSFAEREEAIQRLRSAVWAAAAKA